MAKTMPYMCELGAGQRVYLDNQGTQTIATTTSSNPGQQQQATSSFQTGVWTAPPQILQTPVGIVIEITTAQGNYFIQVQGNSVGLMTSTPAIGSAQHMQMQQVATAPTTPTTSMPSMSPMSPMPSMSPMQPMTMGNMQMQMNPMEMRLGNMEMRMGEPAPTATPPATRRFCSQCGVPVKESDRFCASCGHKLD